MEGFYQAQFLAVYEKFSEQGSMTLFRLTVIGKLEVVSLFIFRLQAYLSYDLYLLQLLELH